MIEIKFRAWDKEFREMKYCFNPICKGQYNFFEFSEYLKNSDYVLMLYTGLKDKKRTKEFPEGQEIYEGDLLKVGGVNTSMEVKWRKDSAGFNLAYLENNEFEVIGNIYE